MLYYTDREMDGFNEYMDYIRDQIAKQSKEKFDRDIDDIDIKHIKREDDGRWTINYTATYPHPVLNVVKKIVSKREKVSGMSKQPSFQTWLAIKIADDRDQKLRDLGL